MIDYWFKQLLETADITPASGPAPRVYDLRHAHVIEIINRHARAGSDPQALTGYLSATCGISTPPTPGTTFISSPFPPGLRAIANAGIEALLPEAGHDIG